MRICPADSDDHQKEEEHAASQAQRLRSWGSRTSVQLEAKVSGEANRVRNLA
jgi:hypothetical protein